MIQVAKSDAIPTILTTKGTQEKARNCQLYDEHSADYDSGHSKFTILSSIYGHESVKQKLIEDQHGKCCFCQADFTANGYGDVEHFRPKAGFTQTRSSSLIRPGYYWMAYEWTNLFFSCQICNQRFKKNYFPIQDETARARNHTFNYELESPLLLHPSIDNPENHISFNRHIPVGNSMQGKTSIKGFGLDRTELNRIREGYLQNVRKNIAFANVDLEALTDNDRQHLSQLFNLSWGIIEELIMTAKAFVAIAASDSQPFSAMVRANFPDLV